MKYYKTWLVSLYRGLLHKYAYLRRWKVEVVSIDTGIEHATGSPRYRVAEKSKHHIDRPHPQSPSPLSARRRRFYFVVGRSIVFFMQLNKLISQSVCTQSLFGNNLSLRLISLTRSRTAASAFPVRGLSALSLVVHVVEDYHNLAAGLDTPTRTRTPPRCSRRRRIMSDAKREADSAALGEKADKRPKSGELRQ